MTTQRDVQGWRAALAAYQRPSHGRSAREIVITVAPLAALWVAALLLAGHGWWWGALLTVPAAGFLVRLFMIQHDCGHGAFFRSGPANTWTGRLIAVLTLTPYEYWRRTHAIHHATSGNLDRRGLGAVETLTVAEYRAAPRLRRLAYAFYRNPLVMFGLGPTYMFVLQHRIPIGLMKDRFAWLSVAGVNLGVAIILAIEIAAVGLGAALLVHLSIVILAATIGVWLFYVQHQFEEGYWAGRDTWTAEAAALHGSSHLVLPPVLAWFTANIGIHHVHHLGSKIPFYRLPDVLRDIPELRQGPKLGILQSFRCARLSLWDEAAARLVPLRQARAT